MAQYYKFFNSTDTDRRTYQAGDFADYFGSVLSTGLIHTDNEAGMEAFVETGTLRTYVTPGKAIMQGHLYENTTNEYLEHSLPESTSDRIDRIVLRLDLRNSERNILLHIKEGDPNSNPVAPSLQRDNFIYELSLAQIRVRANTSSLEASDLVDERLDEGLCGLVNSMLTVPTSQFLSEWNTFMDTIRDQSPASQGDLDNLEDQVSSHLAEGATDDVHGLLSGGHIIEESGSNDDGYYIKFSDGTLICRHTTSAILPTVEGVVFNLPYPAVGGFSSSLSSYSNLTSPDMRRTFRDSMVIDRPNGWTIRIQPSGDYEVAELRFSLSLIGRWK